jgi:hypothetical protein
MSYEPGLCGIDNDEEDFFVVVSKWRMELPLRPAQNNGFTRGGQQICLIDFINAPIRIKYTLLATSTVPRVRVLEYIVLYLLQVQVQVQVAIVLVGRETKSKSEKHALTIPKSSTRVLEYL